MNPHDLARPSPLPPRGLVLVIAQRRAMRGLFAGLLASVAARGGPVRVLDGGNLFPGYLLARELRRRTGRLDAALERITVARAFTSRQMLALLADADAAPGATLILGLMAAFYDNTTPFGKRQRLAGVMVNRLDQLARAGLVVAMTAPPPRGPAEGLLRPVLQIADQVWQAIDARPPVPRQLRLL